jgi:hypothetical protein
MEAFPESPSTVHYDEQCQQDNSTESHETCYISIRQCSSYDPAPSFVLSSDNKMVPVIVVKYDIFLAIRYHIITTDELFDLGEANMNEGKRIAEIVKKCNPKSVTFNFECCSELTHEHFPNEEQTFRSIGLLIRNSYTVQVADFSLKALISAWKRLESSVEFHGLMGGNCPIKNLGTCNSRIILKFNVGTLLECNIPQLKAVGALSEKDMLSLLVARSKITGMRIDRVKQSIKSLDSMCIKEAHTRNIVCYSMFTYTKEEAVVGAFVIINPSTGYSIVAIFRL